jgi:hypothetical protein
MHDKFYNNECVIICLYIYIDIVHEDRLFLAYNFDMKDIVKQMSCWTLNLLEIMTTLFYLIHIMFKRCFKNLSIFIIYLCLHHMIHTWLRIMVMVFCKKNMHK